MEITSTYRTQERKKEKKIKGTAFFVVVFKQSKTFPLVKPYNKVTTHIYLKKKKNQSSYRAREKKYGKMVCFG